MIFELFEREPTASRTDLLTVALRLIDCSAGQPKNSNRHSKRPDSGNAALWAWNLEPDLFARDADWKEFGQLLGNRESVNYDF